VGLKLLVSVAEGRLGKIHCIQAAIGGAPSSPAIPSAAVPQELDWDRWLGPTPLADYRVSVETNKSGRKLFTNNHFNFRWWYEYSGGKLTDWGAHHIDIAMWALQANGQTDGLISIGGEATHPVPFKDGYPTQNDRYNTATHFVF